MLKDQCVSAKWQSKKSVWLFVMTPCHSGLLNQKTRTQERIVRKRKKKNSLCMSQNWPASKRIQQIKTMSNSIIRITLTLKVAVDILQGEKQQEIFVRKHIYSIQIEMFHLCNTVHEVINPTRYPRASLPLLPLCKASGKANKHDHHPCELC